VVLPLQAGLRDPDGFYRMGEVQLSR
jgi:hypothetical protein